MCVVPDCASLPSHQQFYRKVSMIPVTFCNSSLWSQSHCVMYCIWCPAVCVCLYVWLNAYTNCATKVHWLIIAGECIDFLSRLASYQFIPFLIFDIVCCRKSAKRDQKNFIRQQSSQNILILWIKSLLRKLWHFIKYNFNQIRIQIGYIYHSLDT